MEALRKPADVAPAAQVPDRVEFETLISDMSARLMAGEPDEVEAAIETALERVRTFFEADRCGLLSVSTDQQHAHVRFASYGEGISPVSGDINLAELFLWKLHPRIR